MEAAERRRRQQACSAGGNNADDPKGRSGAWRLASRTPFIAHAPHHPLARSSPSLAITTRCVRPSSASSGGERSRRCRCWCNGSDGQRGAGRRGRPAEPAGDEQGGGGLGAGGGRKPREPREPRRASKISKGRRLSTVEVGVSKEGGRVTLDRMPQNLLSTNYISYLAGGTDCDAWRRYGARCQPYFTQPLRKRIPVTKRRVAARSRRSTRRKQGGPGAKRRSTRPKQSRKSNLYLEIFRGLGRVHGRSSFFYRDAHLDLGQEASKSAKYKLLFLLCLAHVLRGFPSGLPRWGGITAPLAALLCCLAAGIRFPSAAMRPVGRCVRLARGGRRMVAGGAWDAHGVRYQTFAAA